MATNATPPPPERAGADLCALLMALLPTRDPSAQWYTPKDIAPLFGIKPRAVMKHCRDLFPELHGHHYRLDRAQTERLVKRMCLAGKKVPSRAEVVVRLRAKEGGQA